MLYEVITGEITVSETVQAAMPQVNIGVVRNLCAAFLFQGDDVDKKIKILSGGDRITSYNVCYTKLLRNAITCADNTQLPHAGSIDQHRSLIQPNELPAGRSMGSFPCPTDDFRVKGFLANVV